MKLDFLRLFKPSAPIQSPEPFGLNDDVQSPVPQPPFMSVRLTKSFLFRYVQVNYLSNPIRSVKLDRHLGDVMSPWRRTLDDNLLILILVSDAFLATHMPSWLRAMLLPVWKHSQPSAMKLKTGSRLHNIAGSIPERKSHGYVQLPRMSPPQLAHCHHTLLF